MAVHDNINHNSNKGAVSDPVRLSLGIFGILLGITAVSGAILSGTRTHADDTTQSDNVTVTVSSACTLSRSAGSGTYSATLNPGQETGDISGSTIKAICNDGNGYSLYAIGYSGDSYTGNNTKMIGTYGNIDTGTSGDNSWWAMKLAPVAGTFAPDIVNSFDSYHVVPATFTQVAKLTSATDAGESANGSSVDAFYKVKASTSQVAGTYTGKVKYTLVHPNTAPAPTIPPNMQDLTSSTIATLLPNIGDTATVRDNRDGNEYTIAKFDDGNYWMTENLRLGKGNGEIITLSSADSNLPSGITFDLKASGMGDNAPDATGDCNVGDWGGDYEEADYNVSHLCINTTTPSYGTYYNWYAATAGTGTYSVGESGDEDATGSICPKGWILPPNAGNKSFYHFITETMGWSGRAGVTAMQQSPYNFLLSGWSYGEGLEDQGTYGYYWSSTAFDSEFAYNLFFSGRYLSPQGSDNKTRGYSVRCVFGS